MNFSKPIQNRPGTMIGAWGYKFFETDHDYNIVAHLGADMGLLTPIASLPRGIDRRRQDSLLNPRNRVFVVQHFKKPNHYNLVFNRYMQRLRDYKVIDVGATLKEGYMSDSPRYYLFILGLLAMQLGCPLAKEHRRWMKANYQDCLPIYERFDQAKMAVFEYEDGKPLKLDSQTVQEKMVALAASTGEQQINVPNVAFELSMIRMYMDNRAAQAAGGTATRGVDISKAFDSEVDISVHEEAAAHKAKTNAYYNMPETPKLSVPNAKFSSWSLNKLGDARIADHAASSGISSEKLDSKGMAKIFANSVSQKTNSSSGLAGHASDSTEAKQKRNRNNRRKKNSKKNKLASPESLQGNVLAGNVLCDS